MSFKVEVIADNSGKWASNALRFRTRKAAEEYGNGLWGRWMAVKEYRVRQSRDPVNREEFDFPGGSARSRRGLLGRISDRAARRAGKR